MDEKENKVDLDLIDKLTKIVETHRDNAYRKVNEELVSMYYEIGRELSKLVKAEKWGSKVITNIASELEKRFPNLVGFDKTNLFRMMQYYETYKDNEIVGALSRQISWTNNRLILSNKSSIEEKEFYIKLCIKNNYSTRELKQQINSHYYERYMLSNDNKILSEYTSNNSDDKQIKTRILDTYCLGFLNLPSNYKEKDLQSQIVDNMKDFILEIGKDFTFIGKEYRLTLSDKDYYIDLLFFNRMYKCLVAFELKVDEFRPEYVSKMDFLFRNIG